MRSCACFPPQFGYRLAQIALEFGIPFVSSSYAGEIAGLDGEARRRGVVILPEMGMDPGIDLILARAAIDELDTVYGLYSYGTGLPEPDCAGDNPLGYKITWTFEGVLKSYCRPARFLKDGEEVRLPGEDIFMEEHGHMVEMTGLGPLEAYPNGDAIHFIEAFDLGPGIRDMGRFALRYPGHRRFWLTMSRLGFLDDTPVTIDGASVSPRRFLVHHLTPRLQFGDRERDVAALRVKAWGVKDGRDVSVTHDLADYRDPDTGLFAMNRMVGFTTSIGVQMILSGVITTPGVLSPARHVPPGLFLEQLEARGMRGERRVEREGDS